MVSCYKIYEYWKNKGILPNGEISDTGGINIVENPHSPSCWACGRPVDKLAVLSWEKYDKEPKELWSGKNVNSKLQRCHILARQFGGPDEVDNLFLLCEDCHAESPDTKNRAAFFRWVYRRRSETTYGLNGKEFMRSFISEIEARGYKFLDFMQMLRGEDLFEITDNALKECGLHGTSIVPSSVVVTVVDELERVVIGKRMREVS